MPKNNTTDKHQTQDWQEEILAVSKGPLRFTLTNDYMFKAIYQTNTYALKGLLASLLGLKLEDNLDVQIINPIQLGKAVSEKDCVLDVKLLLNSNRIINLEMQVVRQTDWVFPSIIRAISRVSKPGGRAGTSHRRPKAG